MKIAVVSTFDVQGGAGRAAAQLHRALRAEGTDATMLVAYRAAADDHVQALEPRLLCKALAFADELRAGRALAPYRATRPQGGDAFRPDGLLLGRLLERCLPAADLINLHWVAGMLDFASLPRLAARAPLVWTLHDMLPLTGGCHYDGGCARHAVRCGACPQLGSGAQDDLSAATFARKAAAYGGIACGRLRFVAPSRWLAAQAARSPLIGRFPVSVIPNCVDVQVFAPSDKAAARAALGLPTDRVIFLFVADDLGNRRKGLHLLVEAMAGLGSAGAGKRPLLVSIGKAPVEALAGPDYLHFSYLEDSRHLARFYAAADLAVLSSLQDNLPLTMLEAMACGTPVLGFAAGGIPDVVRDGDTGILVPPGSVEGLRAALLRVAGDPAPARAMGERARAQMLADHTPAAHARAYLALFAQVLQPQDVAA
jgi:glycosyltransferase involved in cell wall biosynthesis